MQRCAAIIGELYFQEKDVKNARYYLYEVLTYQGGTLKANAFDRIYELRENEKNTASDFSDCKKK